MYTAEPVYKGHPWDRQNDCYTQKCPSGLLCYKLAGHPSVTVYTVVLFVYYSIVCSIY